MAVEKAVIPVQGMICRSCEDIVCTALLHTRGVIDAKASYWRGSAQVEYDTELTDLASLEKMLELSGYPAGEKGASGIVVDIICLVAAAALVMGITALKGSYVPKAEAGMSLGYMFLLGLISSTHCIGMCGGILLSQTAGACGENAGRKKALRASLAYNGGRVASYTVIGGIFGAVGAAISYTATVKSMVFTLAGAVVALIGLQMWGVLPFLRRLAPETPSFCKLPDSTKKRFFGKPLIIGLLTGIMPCGATAAVWFYAAGTGSLWTGCASMLLFALGTAPLMLVFGAVGAFVPRKYMKYMLKGSAVMVLALGVSMLISGLKMI